MRPRDLAHRLSDELPPPRPTIEPIITTWRTAAAIVLQALALAAGFYGLVVVLAILASPAP